MDLSRCVIVVRLVTAACRIALCLVALLGCHVYGADVRWKAGTAVTDITPGPGQWLAGFGNRTRPADGTLHPLFVKALALEDANGGRAVILSTDLLGIPQTIYNHVCAELKRRSGLDRAQIMLNASHSHCTPVLRGALYDAYPMPEAQKEIIERYSRQLEEKIVATTEQALRRLEPAVVSAGQGITRFAVNRRNNAETAVNALRRDNALKGPVDHSVPVLSVTDDRGALKAVVFGYACHNTSLTTLYKWAGDYAGYAQMTLERSHPGAVAMFFSGCGADANALPRGTEVLSQRYGNMLASAVEEVLLQNPAPLAPSLVVSHAFVDLPLADFPSREELESTAADPMARNRRWAARLLAEATAGKSPIRTYPYPVQAWLLGGQQLWITLGGEVVVDYALRFKREFGAGTWIAAYCNDVMAYIPSARVLKEDKPPRLPLPRSGYEGNTSMHTYGMPAHRWAENVEELVAETADTLVRKVRLAR